MSFEKYLNVVSGSFKRAVKIEWLNPDETVAFEFTNSLYDINVDLSVNYQNGSRRTCTLTLNNDRNQFPINFNNIWFGQKFKLWMGVYIDEKTPYYFPQGVFFISNPNEAYQPSTRTIKINGVDKWAYLDGTLSGNLSGTYQTNIGTNLFDATRSLLQLPTWIQGIAKKLYEDDFDQYFSITSGNFNHISTGNSYIKLSPNGNVNNLNIEFKTSGIVSFDVSRYVYQHSRNWSRLVITLGNTMLLEEYNTTVIRPNNIMDENGHVKPMRVNKGDVLSCQFTSSGSTSDYVTISNFVFENTPCIDPITPLLSKSLELKKDSSDNNIINCPYTAKVERGKTYADVLLEYATILCAHIYYDVNGRLVIEPAIDSADDITDTDKEVVWHFTVEEKQLLGLNQVHNFDKVYNDIIVLGNVANGYQFKARVQNRNLMSDTCVQKIGLKSKEPIEDNQYYSDDQCKELAMYYAKVDTMLQKSGDISSTPLFHLDVNKLVSVSTPNNNMSKELFLITGYTLNSSNSMTVNVASINILKDFSVVEVDINE